MSRELLRVENLTKIFRMGSIFSRTKIVAVNNVSFDIKEGEIFTLAGESGSGKTTVSRIILGFLEPDGGKIFYKGKEMRFSDKEERSQFLREIQAIFQNPFETFNPLKKVDRYLLKTAKNFGVDQGKIVEALKMVGLSYEDVVGKYPQEFSGGQLQRISIARAVILEPSLIVADEPVSMVDASLRMSIINLFKELVNRLKISVLYITHDLATAYYVSDRIAIMLRGNIVEMGSVEKVLGDPKHPYTIMLKESVPEPDPRKAWSKEINLSAMERIFSRRM